MMSMINAMPLAQARALYRPDADIAPPPVLADPAALLNAFHPDYVSSSVAKLSVGANAGDNCQRELAGLLQAEAKASHTRKKMI